MFIMIDIINRKLLSVFAALLALPLLFSGCQLVEYIGNSRTGFEEVKRYKIQPQQALKLAEPYLDMSFKMRQKGRTEKIKGQVMDTIVMTGPWYYIVRDNYPYKNIQAYLKHAVMVHADTGCVVRPE